MEAERGKAEKGKKQKGNEREVIFFLYLSHDNLERETGLEIAGEGEKKRKGRVEERL